VAEDPAGQGAVAGTPPAGSVTQALLMVVSFALAISLLYMVVVLVRGGGGSTFYNFLAALSVLGAGMGFWVGYIATYPLVTRLTQSLGGAGTTILFVASLLSPGSSAEPISIGVSVVTGFASALPRIAEAGTTGVMVFASLFVFEATRRGYIDNLAIVAAPALMTAAALLLGNAFAELYGQPPSTDQQTSAPLQ
jgi:hypothetical protein